MFDQNGTGWTGIGEADSQHDIFRWNISGKTLTTAFLKTDGAKIDQYDRYEILELSDKYLKVESDEGVRLFERIDSASGDNPGTEIGNINLIVGKWGLVNEIQKSIFGIYEGVDDGIWIWEFNQDGTGSWFYPENKTLETGRYHVSFKDEIKILTIIEHDSDYNNDDIKRWQITELSPNKLKLYRKEVEDVVWEQWLEFKRIQ